MQYVIGVDFGTQSARAILVSTETGETLLQHQVRYAHGEGDEGLIDPRDYDAALEELLTAVSVSPYREDVVGVCVDATSLTLVPLGKDGRALAYQPGMEDRPQARIKLWKRHTASRQTEEAQALAEQMKQPFLSRTGGSVSNEWVLPKLMELYDEDPAAFQATDLAMDLCEYLTFRLTGKPVRSVGSLCYKCLWAKDLGFPSKEYLNALRPGLGEAYPRLLRGPVLSSGEAAGMLLPEWCEKTGLSPKTAVGAGVLDGHTTMIAMGALHPGDTTLVAGTSNVISVHAESLHEVMGVCGIAKDAQIPGLYSVDAGQNCTGDMLEWFLNNMLPQSYTLQAEQLGVSPHELLAQKVRSPWENRVVIADWWNGSRNAPSDLSLEGMISGLTLRTRPEDLYLAMLQAIVCGAGAVLDLCASCGMETRRLFAGGGIAKKNRLLMEQMASLLGRPILVADHPEAPALGTAILAAVAAGVHPTAEEACRHMGMRDFTRVEPDLEHAAEYRALYEKSLQLRKAAIELHNS